MFHAVAHFAFALLLCGWGVLIGIGISADVLRWLRERRQQSGKRVSKAYGGLH